MQFVLVGGLHRLFCSQLIVVVALNKKVVVSLLFYVEVFQ